MSGCAAAIRSTTARLLARREEPVLRACDPDRRVAALDLGTRAREDSRLAAEEVDGVATLGRVREEELHQVGAVHAPGHRVAERPGGPDDGHAVRGDQIAELDGPAQLAVRLDADELGGVQRRVQGRPARGDGLVHARDCVVQGDRVERRAEEVDRG